MKTKLIGTQEFAKLAGVTKQAVVNWRARYADFPEPVAELRMGPIWHEAQALAWISIHRSRRQSGKRDR